MVWNEFVTFACHKIDEHRLVGLATHFLCSSYKERHLLQTELIGARPEIGKKSLLIEFQESDTNLNNTILIGTLSDFCLYFLRLRLMFPNEFRLFHRAVGILLNYGDGEIALSMCEIVDERRNREVVSRMSIAEYLLMYPNLIRISATTP